MFYDQLLKLCKEKNIKPTTLLTELGMSKGSMANWKSGKLPSGAITPNIDVLAKISKVLNTSIDFLIGAVPFQTIISSEEEQDIILYYRGMSKSGKRMLMGDLEKLKDR